MGKPRLWKKVAAAFSGGRSAGKPTRKSTTAAKKTTGTANNTAKAKNADQSKATKPQPTLRKQSATRTTATPNEPADRRARRHVHIGHLDDAAPLSREVRQSSPPNSSSTARSSSTTLRKRS